jgi:hypothetical protein
MLAFDTVRERQLAPDRFEEKTSPMAQWRRLLRRAGAILCALFGGFLRLRPALAAPDPVGASAIIAMIAAGMFSWRLAPRRNSRVKITRPPMLLVRPDEVIG